MKKHCKNVNATKRNAIFVTFVIVIALLCSLVLVACDKTCKHALTHHEKIDATCTTDGTVECWSCSKCNKNFADSKGEKELTDLVIKAGHKFENNVCTGCGKVEKYTEGLSYELAEDGEGYVVAGIGTVTDTNVFIPNTYNNLPVTRIGEFAFKECRSLISVTLPDSVTSIGPNAFPLCYSLTSINIPDSVTSIGHNAFAGCSSLTSITIPDSVTSIGTTAFYGCDSLKEVHIKDIAKWCAIEFGNSFANPLSNRGNLYVNNQLVTELVIPDGVTSIGRYAFASCFSFTSVTIPDSVVSIRSDAFDDAGYIYYNSPFTIYCEIASEPSGWEQYWNRPEDHPVVWDCKNNEIAEDGYIYTIINGIRYALKDGQAIVAGQLINISGDIIIPESVTYKDITYIVTSIRSNAFANCFSLTSVTIPDSVTSIGVGAFFECTSLGTINYNGTMQEWKNISKESGWNGYTNDFKIICTDGTLDKNGNVVA